jgi:hypothetical protein
MGSGSGSGSGSDTTKCTDVKSVSGDWMVSGNSDISGTVPSSCYTLDGSLTITGPDVDSLSGLGDLRGVGDLVIMDTSLTKIDTPSMIHVTNSITIQSNDELEDLSNIDVKSADVLQSITVTQNGSLTGLNRLNRVQMVGGDVKISNNDSLTTIDLTQLKQAAGNLVIDTNKAVTTLKLGSLNLVGPGNFQISNNTALTSMGSLSALQYVHGTLTIDNNDALATLDDAMTTGLVSIDLDLQITNNALLTSLGQLSHSGRIGGQMLIQNNGSMLYCAAREVGCCVSHASDVISGNKTTNDNGCAHSWCYAQNGNACPFQY